MTVSSPERRRCAPREMALHEVRLVSHVSVHPAPAVLLHDGVKEIQRGVVIGRIDGDHLSRKLRLEEILRRFRHILRRTLLL